VLGDLLGDFFGDFSDDPSGIAAIPLACPSSYASWVCARKQRRQFGQQARELFTVHDAETA
jgi:hypothetical protein